MLHGVNGSGFTELTAAGRLAIAALVGLGVGLEREWSGHASGPGARFAGLRTFLILGLLGGCAGLLIALGFDVAGGLLAFGGVAFAAIAYAMAVRRPTVDLDGTTEAAALVVVALGVMSGIGWVGLAAGAASLVVLALSEKTRLQWAVRHIDERELRATLQFAVLALVVLPLLPTGPYLGMLDIRPRSLWTIVLVFSGLNFAGYLARRAVGPERGYTITGALGGLVSSTAVSLTFARASRAEPKFAASLSRGVIGACTILLPRIVVISAVLYFPVANALAPIVLPATLVGAAFVLLLPSKGEAASAAVEREAVNPLRLASALRMAILFQGAIVIISFVQQYKSAFGLYATGAIFGLTDMDALTVSMSREETNVLPRIAARVIVAGILSNTVAKATIAGVFGGKGFRARTVLGLAALATALVAGVLIA